MILMIPRPLCTPLGLLPVDPEPSRTKNASGSHILHDLKNISKTRNLPIRFVGQLILQLLADCHILRASESLVSPIVFPAIVTVQAEQEESAQTEAGHGRLETGLQHISQTFVCCKQVMPTGYFGSSEARKNCGPTILPTQYATKSEAPTTLFFEKPATLDVMRLKEMGRLTAKAMLMTRPTIRPASLDGSSFQTRAMPIRETMVLNTMQRIRADGRNVAAIEVRGRNTI
jgi:hypothetical protein